MDFEHLEAMIRVHGLHMLRVMTAVWLLPQFGAGTGTRLQRLAVGLCLGSSLSIWATPGDAWVTADPWRFALLATQEVTIGCLLGWMTAILIEVGTIAGSLIATEMGMHMSAQMDPSSKTSLPLIAFLWRNIAIVLFFSSGCHFLVMGAFLESYEILPVGEIPDPELLKNALLTYASAILSAGLRLAAPVFFVLTLVTVSVGFLTKMAPKLHVLEASFPIRIIASMVLMVAFMPRMIETMDGLFKELVETMMNSLAGI